MKKFIFAPFLILFPLFTACAGNPNTNAPISALPAASGLNSSDVIPIVQNNVTKKIDAAAFFNSAAALNIAPTNGANLFGIPFAGVIGLGNAAKVDTNTLASKADLAATVVTNVFWMTTQNSQLPIAKRGAICYTLSGGLFIKTNSTTDTNGWNQTIADRP